jgi:hypothetical protein
MNSKSTNKIIEDPQYYIAERHTNSFNPYQRERTMETSVRRNQYGVVLFAGGKRNA